MKAKMFPNGIRIGTKVTIRFADGSSKQKMSKAINPYCDPNSAHRDSSGRDLDFYHYLDQDAYTGNVVQNGVDVPNGIDGVVSYIYSNSNGQAEFHVYIEKLDACIFCSFDYLSDY